MASTQGSFVVNIAGDITAFAGRLDYVQRDNLPFVTAYALTKTAEDIKDEEISVMAHVFDRPTRFTLNALYVRAAAKTNLQAVVAFKDGFGSVPAWRYLGPEVEGGPRVKKAFERALERAGFLRAGEFCVPSKAAPLDGNGNVSGSLITQMLSGLGANPDALSNTTAKSKKRNPSRGVWFVLRGVKRAPDGIYRRTGGRSLQPIFLFVRQPHYRKRFPFYETAKAVMVRRFAVRFREGMARYGNSQRKAA